MAKRCSAGMTSHPASVQHRGASSWDTCGLPNASGCQQSTQRRHLGCSYSPGDLSLQRAVFTPAGYTNPVKERYRRNTEGGSNPSFQPVCLGGGSTWHQKSRAVGWGGCALLFLLLLGFLPWDPWVLRGERPWGQCNGERAVFYCLLLIFSNFLL